MNALVRQGIQRNDYKVTPGLYALGNPTEYSDVFVTANYKLSVDVFREDYKGDGWLLVLDTHGINVWCAAGKGTFGTTELIRMIAKCRLNRLLKHKRIIVPQLGAPGVSGYQVKLKTGFDIVFGPVRCEDINDFILNGYQANKEMRKVTFNFGERMILTPLESVQSIRYSAATMLLFSFVSWIAAYFTMYEAKISHLVLGFLMTTLIGSVAFPAVLPYLKGKSFTVKAMPLTLLWVISSLLILLRVEVSPVEALGIGLSGAALIEFYALNFTGATPITSYSETKEETLKVMPWIIGIYCAGILLFSLSVGQVI